MKNFLIYGSYGYAGSLIVEQAVKQGGDFVLAGRPEIVVESRSYKMSKSRGNVINPDAIVAEYGADSLRLYEMFMGPLEATKPWSMAGVSLAVTIAWCCGRPTRASAWTTATSSTSSATCPAASMTVAGTVVSSTVSRSRSGTTVRMRNMGGLPKVESASM